MYEITISRLSKLLGANAPVILIRDFDYARTDCILDKAKGEYELIEWNPSGGHSRFYTKESKENGGDPSLAAFLKEVWMQDPCYRKPRILVLKGIEDWISSGDVRFSLSMIAQRFLYDKGIADLRTSSFETRVVIVSAWMKVPEDLIPYVSYLDVDFPSETEIEEIIREHVEVNGDYQFKEEYIPALILALKGMARFDIDRVLDMAMGDNGTLTPQKTELILEHKKQIVKQSGVLELIDSRVQANDIGGLDDLKAYLERKARVFKYWKKADDYGVQMPKGVFIVGMPGCGKSLCAKAAAQVFGSVPLVKLDIGSIMGKYVGESEEHLRKAIKSAEAAAPCILWVDEIEKAFSGIGDEGNSVLTRVFGYFLTWMQEKNSQVYVIATANKVDHLPPELKRKGRFDEVYCVHLPVAKERKAIFSVHLDKLKGKRCYQEMNSSTLEELAARTEGYCGADIEAIVKDAVECCFEKDQILTQKVLLDSVDKTIPISDYCKDEIDQLKETLGKSTFRNALTGIIGSE